MKKSIVFILLLSVLASCNKDEKCNQDMAGISGTYRITGVTYKSSPSAAEQDYYSQFFPDPCERDDNIVLNANGTYTYNDAGVKCVPAGDDSGTWSQTGNTVIIDGSPSTIQSFNCSALVIAEADVLVLGDQLKLTLTRL